LGLTPGPFVLGVSSVWLTLIHAGGSFLFFGKLNSFGGSRRPLRTFLLGNIFRFIQQCSTDEEMIVTHSRVVTKTLLGIQGKYMQCKRSSLITYQKFFRTCLLLSDLLSLGVFSVWLCDPVSFQNDVNGCFDAIYHFLSVHCGLEGLKRADLYNVYHHFHSKRGPSVYNRYK
jgi:hypothetical protein